MSGRKPLAPCGPDLLGSGQSAPWTPTWRVGRCASSLVTVRRSEKSPGFVGANTTENAAWPAAGTTNGVCGTPPTESGALGGRTDLTCRSVEPWFSMVTLLVAGRTGGPANSTKSGARWIRGPAVAPWHRTVTRGLKGSLLITANSFASRAPGVGPAAQAMSMLLEADWPIVNGKVTAGSGRKSGCPRVRGSAWTSRGMSPVLRMVRLRVAEVPGASAPKSSRDWSTLHRGAPPSPWRPTTCCSVYSVEPLTSMVNSAVAVPVVVGWKSRYSERLWPAGIGVDHDHGRTNCPAAGSVPSRKSVSSAGAAPTFFRVRTCIPEP